MLRIACCLGTERGIRICAPVHDAILIEAPANEIEQAAARCRITCAPRRGLCSDGFELRTEARSLATRTGTRSARRRYVGPRDALIAREGRKAHKPLSDDNELLRHLTLPADALKARLPAPGAARLAKQRVTDPFVIAELGPLKEAANALAGLRGTALMLWLFLAYETKAQARGHSAGFKSGAGQVGRLTPGEIQSPGSTGSGRPNRGLRRGRSELTGASWWVGNEVALVRQPHMPLVRQRYMH